MGGEEPSNLEREYREVCRDDSDVKSCDDSLKAEIERVINATAEGGLSMDSLKMVTSCLAEQDRRFKNLILENRKDIWKDRNLRELVELYEELNITTSKFYNGINNCLGKMKGKLSLLQVALRFISPANPPPGKAQYSKCKEKLEEFLKAENSFSEDFSDLLKSAHVQHQQILEKLHAKKSKLDKTLKRVRTCRKIFYILFATVTASFFICAVVAGTMASAPYALIVFTLISNPVSSVVQWFSSKLAKYEKTVKVNCEAVGLMQKLTYGGLYELNQIKVSAERLESSIDLILESVDLYCKDEANQQDAVENIREEGQSSKNQFDVLEATVGFIREKRWSHYEDQDTMNTPKAVAEDMRNKQDIFEDHPNTHNISAEDIRKKQPILENQIRMNTKNAVVEDIINQNFEDQPNNHKALLEDTTKQRQSSEDTIHIQNTLVEDITEEEESLEDQISTIRNTVFMEEITEIKESFEDDTKDIKGKKKIFDDQINTQKKNQSFEDQTNIQNALGEEDIQMYKDQKQNNFQSALVDDVMKKHKSFGDRSNINNAAVIRLAKKHRSFEEQTNIQKAVADALSKELESFKNKITKTSNHVNCRNQEIQNNSVQVIFKNIRV